MERRKLFTGLIFVLLLFLIVWIVVAVRWGIADHHPSNIESIFYLLVLPFLLLGTFFGVNKTVKHIQQRRKQSNNEEDEEVNLAEVDPTLAWQLPLTAIGVMVADGNKPAALVKAALDGKRAEINPDYKDARQQPAFAVGIKELDVELVNETASESINNWPDAKKRTLAIAESLAVNLLDTHFDALRLPVDPDDPDARQPVPVLQIDWVFPAEWNEPEYQQAVEWLSLRLAEQGWKAPELHVVAKPLEVGKTSLHWVDELNTAYHRKALHTPHLLLLADSHLDSATLSRWDIEQQLYSGNQPEGKVPGEGGAALLVAPEAHHVETLPLALGRQFAGERKKSVGEPQKLQANALTTLAEQARKALDVASASEDNNKKEQKEKADADTDTASDTPTEPKEWQLVADTDMRGSRQAEALFFTGQFVPEQDVTTSLLALGVANGSVDLITPIAAIAVAAQQCIEEKKPCLVFSNQAERLRSTMTVVPVEKPTAAKESLAAG